MRFLAAISEIYVEGIIVIWSPVCLKNKGEDKRDTKKWVRGDRSTFVIFSQFSVPLKHPSRYHWVCSQWVMPIKPFALSLQQNQGCWGQCPALLKGLQAGKSGHLGSAQGSSLAWALEVLRSLSTHLHISVHECEHASVRIALSWLHNLIHR